MHEEGSSASSDTNHADEGLYSEPVLETAEAEEPFELDPEVLGVYEQRMTSLFPDSVKPPSPQPAVAVPGALGADDQDGSEDEFSQRPMTKKEKQTAKRRRQRERQRIAEAEAEEAERRRAEEERKVMEAEPVSFRLYSSCPVMPVQIVRQPDIYPLPSNPLHLPLDEATASRIRRIAEESAIAGPSAIHISFDTAAGTSNSLRSFRLKQAGEVLPPYFVGEIDDPARADALPATDTESTLLPAVEPRVKSPKKLDLVPSDLSLPAATGKRRSRGRRRSNKDPYRPPPRFYAPPSGLGGKSRGYAWGWRDSQEGMREHEHGYLRS